MKDKCGVEITVGCCVDVYVSDVLTAFVVDMKDGGLVGADGRPEPARLVLSIGIPMKLNPGQVAPCYVVRQAEVAPDRQQVEAENGRVH